MYFLKNIHIHICIYIYIYVNLDDMYMYIHICSFVFIHIHLSMRVIAERRALVLGLAVLAPRLELPEVRPHLSRFGFRV